MIDLAISLLQVLAEHKSIVSFFQQFHADAEGPFGITGACLETFVKSCAGYCVIMYILGVGDRYAVIFSKRHVFFLNFCSKCLLNIVGNSFLLSSSDRKHVVPMVLRLQGLF